MTKEVFSRVLDYNTGLTGASVLSALTIKYGAFQGFICQDYTVVQVITDAQGNDVTAQMGLRGVTLSPGIYISMASGDSIYSIILSSGSIILYDLGADMSSVPGVSDLITAFSTRASVDGATLESISCIDGPLMPYFKKASFYLTPSAYKGGKLYAQKPITGNGDLTWTRGSDAFRTNSSGLVQRMPWNLLQRSEEFSNAIWSKLNSSITANIINAPNGTLTADKLVEDSTNNTHYNTQQIPNSNSLLTYSVYAKAGERTFLLINAFATLPNNFTYVPSAVFNLSNGTVGTTSSCNASIQNVGDGWYRCVIQCTSVFASTSSTVNFYNYISLTNSVFSYQGDGTSGIYIWGAQVVEGTSAQTYLPTTDRLGFPRLDYTYGTCPAALLEPQRTNLATWSNDFDNAAWTKTRVTVIANQATSPDGTQNADKIYPNSSGSVFVYEMMAATTAVDKCVSFYVKAAGKNYCWLLNSSGNIGCRFDLINGTVVNTPAGNVGTISSVGNGWYKITNKDNSASNYVGIGVCDSSSTDIATVNGTDGLFIFGGQLEVGSYPTTYIPTTSATVTRIADSFSRSNIYTNGLISASGGTWFVELRGNTGFLRVSGFPTLFVGSTTNGYSGDAFGFSSNNVSADRLGIYRLVNGSLSIITTTTTNTIKVAFAWTSTTLKVYLNGTLINTATGLSWNITTLQNLVGIAEVPLFIQQMALFPAPLTDTECAAMTTI